MILKNIRKGGIQDLNFDHLHFKVVSDPLSVNLINLHSIHGLVIKSDDKIIVRKVLHQLRTKNDPYIYLLPVYLDSRSLFKKMGKEVDGYIMEGISPINSSTGDQLLARIDQIKTDVSKITDYNERMVFKALQYIHTRESGLEAYRDRTSPIGYHIPFLSTVISDKDIVHAMNFLDKMTGKGLLKHQLIDKVNLCHTCQGSYLNFHEACSKCSSLDLDYENLVHHFRCAYIGPESDFKHGDDMICPKCDKQLKHIGIDYDKPAEVATCKQCTHTSQETKMKANCVDCGEQNSLSQLKTLDIKKYSLTMAGIDAITATDFTEVAQEQELTNLNIVPSPIFNLLLEQERIRSANREYGSSFAGEIKIEEGLFKELAEDFRNQLKSEILAILQTYLREVDILTARSTGHYAFILPDCKQNKAYELYLMVLDNLNKLLSDNMESSGPMVTGDLQKL